LAKLTKREQAERLRDRIEIVRRDRNNAYAEYSTLDDTLYELEKELNELLLK